MPAKHTRKGELYLGVIISMGILLILTQAIVTLVFSAYDYINFSKARTSARHLAQKQMELIRNMPFDDIGTLGGIPSGVLQQTENIPLNGQNYDMRTSIIYIDDPFDDTAPDDLVPNDYKRVRVDVSWGGLAASAANNITLFSDVAPNGVEQITGGGTLSILVIDAVGQPVSQAEVHIEASSLNPPVDLTQFTSATGRVLLPGAPACASCYRISISKSGYSEDRTYSSAEIANPTNPDVSSLEGQLTELSFTIDRFSTVNLATVSGNEGGFLPLANQTINLRGTKIIGTNEFDEPTYKVNLDITTDGTGNFVIEDLEWDSYELTLPDGSPRTISAANPFLPLVVAPDEETSLTLALSPNTPNTLWAIFRDQTQQPIASTSASIKYDDTEQNYTTGEASSPDFGQVFFSGLQPVQYTVEATASGFQPLTETVNVSGNTIHEFIMQTP